jgi:hypothetical protein
MDENGESRVGFQESLKYRTEGGMMRERKYFGLLVMLLFAFVALLAPTTANSEIQTLETVTGTGTDQNDKTWTVMSTVKDACDLYTDKKGNAIQGIWFEYIVTPPVDYLSASIQQANVDFKVCEPAFSLTYPQNRSIKIRDYDPNFPEIDLFSDLVTLDSLKSEPNLQTKFDYCVDPATFQNATLTLQTEFGYVIVPSLGPDCCSNVQRITEATLSLPEGTICDQNGNPGNCWLFDPYSQGSVDLSFDACSGDINAVPEDHDSGYIYQLIPGGGYICQGDLTSYDRNKCDLIQVYGPEPLGSTIITTSHIYVGYAASVWRGPIVDDYPSIITLVDCVEADAYSPTSLTYGDATIELDWCGNLQENEDASLWFCEGAANGNRDASTCTRILTATGNMTGTCYIWKNGAWRRYPDRYCR